MEGGVTATGHGRIIMPGSKNYYVDRKWGQAIGESSSPSNSGRSSREGAKVLTQIRKRHDIGSRQGGRFTAKKKRNPNSQFQASPRKRKVAFSRGPVKGEIPVTKWHNRSRLCWGKNLRLNVKEKENKNWCLATR